MQQDLRVAARLKDRAVAHQVVTQLARIDQVSVVRDRNLAVRAIDQKWLRIRQPAFPRCGVAGMADRKVPWQLVKRLFVERVGHVPHRPHRPHTCTV